MPRLNQKLGATGFARAVEIGYFRTGVSRQGYGAQLAMSKKKYASADQREILTIAGVSHRPGRTFDEAEALIIENIQSGKLPSDICDRATIRQRAALEKLGVDFPSNISQSEASLLLDQHTAPTEKQIEFLRGLGGYVSSDLTKQSASELIEQLIETAPMSEGQAQQIAKLGGVVDRSMTYKNAGEFIEYLYEFQVNCTRCGSNLDRRVNRCSCGAYTPKFSLIRPPRCLLSPGVESPKEGQTRSVVVRFLNWLRFDSDV